MDTAIQTADSRMMHITQDEEEMLAYERYFKAECDKTSEMNFAISKGKAEGEAIGMVKGEAIGIAKGEAKGKAEIIALLKKGVSLEEIEKLLP